MQLNLTDEETRTLSILLHAHLPGLRREVARTDARDFRHELVKQQDLCERLIEVLDRTG